MLGILDRLWRTRVKIAETPRRRMARSLSRTQSPDRGYKQRSKSSFGNSPLTIDQVPPAAAAVSGDLADHSAECLVKSLKCCMSAFYSEAELPSFTAGETKLNLGRVSGLWKVSRGEKFLICKYQICLWCLFIRFVNSLVGVE